MSIELTAEEIALIEKKRAEEKVKKDEILNAYAKYKAKKLESVEIMVINNERDEEAKLVIYQKHLADIHKVSPDYELSVRKLKVYKTADLYDIDVSGYEIRYSADEKGNTIWLEAKETIKLETYQYVLSINYTGNVPEGCQYYITLSPKRSKYSNAIVGYKMKVNGTNISSSDDRQKFTVPKTAHNKIVEAIKAKFSQIEYLDYKEKSHARILEKAKIEFSQYDFKSHGLDNEFSVILGNGISVTFFGFEDTDGNISFSRPKVNFPYGKFEVKNLLDGLNNIK